MTRGFTLQDISCLTLESSNHAVPISTSASASASNQQQQQDEQDSGGISSSSSSSSGGLFASGMAWVDKQRENRRREHLQLEAEKQLQKIAHAERAARRFSCNNNNNNNNNNRKGNNNKEANGTATSTATANRIVVDRTTNHSLVNSNLPSSSLSQQQDVGNNNGGNSNSNSNSGGNNNNNNNNNANYYAANQNTRRPQQQQQQQQRQHQYSTQKSNSFGTSDVSKSGEGASGMLDLSDMNINVLGDNDHNNHDHDHDYDYDGRGSTIIREQQQQQNQQQQSNEDEEDEDIIPPVRVTKVEGDEASPYILSQDQMNDIVAKHVIPETIMYCRWRRLYGLGRDGDSFEGCLRIIGSVKRTLMVVRTTRGDIFGGYADAPWHSRQDYATAKFYGSASSCLFSFSTTTTTTTTTASNSNSNSKPNSNSNNSNSSSSDLNVYRWTGKNRYIQVCDVSNKMLAFGGGGDKGAFGLCLQEDFQRGSTGHCDTFDNDPLCNNTAAAAAAAAATGAASQSKSQQEQTLFDIVDVEFWEFLTGVF